MDDDDLDRLEAIERRHASINRDLDALAHEGTELARLASAGQFSTARLRAFRQRSADLQAQITHMLDELDQIGTNA